MAQQPWRRRAGESPKAYAAFEQYYRLSPRERSIDAAWTESAPNTRPKRAQVAPRHWHDWSSKYEWVSRAAAYDDEQAEQNRLLWEQRRRQLQERDWQQADALRAVVDEAIPHANQFIRRQTTTIRGHDGQPDQIVVTLAFDINALSKVLTDVSKLQRQATGQSTEHIELSGAALDAAIERIALGLAGLADGSQTQAAGAPATHESPGDGAPNRADTPPTSGDEAL